MDRELRISEIPDYPGAFNGLQMEGRGEVRRVAAAVDASLPVVREAAEAGADLLLVHHGMFWGGTRPVTGAVYEKFKVAIEAGLAIYSAHLPLDVHPELGNNRLLAGELGLRDPEPCFEWKGILTGWRGQADGSFHALVARAARVLGAAPHVCAAGPAEAGSVAVVTGAAGSEVPKVAQEGIDTFVTGEGPHWSYTAAEELGLNVIYGGHYATETFGVRALAARLAESFGMESFFIDHPTGL